MLDSVSIKRLYYPQIAMVRQSWLQSWLHSKRQANKLVSSQSVLT